MTTHHTSLYDEKTNPAPNGVLKQELMTLEQTSDGIRITRLKRRFSGDAVNISFDSGRKERMKNAMPQMIALLDSARHLLSKIMFKIFGSHPSNINHYTVS